MQFVEMGNPSGKTMLLLPGTACDYQTNFAAVLDRLGDERAVLCICHMDKEYLQGFRHIRCDRNSTVSEGAGACEYRLRFDPEKD